MRSAIVWLAGSVWLSLPWLRDLGGYVGPFGAIAAVTLVAYIPALLMAFMAMSLLLDRQPALRVSQSDTGVTIVIAARNEEAGIAETVRSAVQNDYAGPGHVHAGRQRLHRRDLCHRERVAAPLGVSSSIIHEPKPGKANALNHALGMVETPYVVTVDADTAAPSPGPAATGRAARERAGRHRCRRRCGDDPQLARVNLLTRMQEWDYFLGIAAVKRMQGHLPVDPGRARRVPLYRTDELRRVGGWPDAIGEDIVVTWRLMATGDRGADRTDGDRVHRCAHAGLTLHAPAGPVGPRHGRSDPHGPAVASAAVLSRFISGIDLLIPLLDIGYGLVWVPGLVLAAFGLPLIVGTWTLAVLPITLLVYGGLRRYQRRRIFAPLHLKVRHNRSDTSHSSSPTNCSCSTASLAGYTQEIAGRAPPLEVVARTVDPACPLPTIRFGLQAGLDTDPRAWLDLARKAEDSGFHALYVADHLGVDRFAVRGADGRGRSPPRH